MDHGTLPIATPVKYQQLEAVVRERWLSLPLLGAGRQRALHQHDARAATP